MVEQQPFEVETIDNELHRIASKSTGDSSRARSGGFVDLERGVIVWPPAECKHRKSHVVPLEGEALAIVRALMEAPPLWRPYLFRGRHCAPGRTPSKSYGYVGDIKKSWATACRKAGFPVGRKAGRFVFHHTRNTAATNLRAGGMDEADVMEITGHTTSHVFRHYDIGDVERCGNGSPAPESRSGHGLRHRSRRSEPRGDFLHSGYMAREPAALLVIEGHRLDTSGQFLKGNVDQYFTLRERLCGVSSRTIP